MRIAAIKEIEGERLNAVQATDVARRNFLLQLLKEHPDKAMQLAEKVLLDISVYEGKAAHDAVAKVRASLGLSLAGQSLTLNKDEKKEYDEEISEAESLEIETEQDN